MSYGFGLGKPSRDDITEVAGLSMHVGGDSPRNEEVVEAIRRLGTILDEACFRLPVEGLVVELKFFVPGPISSPDFEGIQRGPFFRSLDALAILIAVPLNLKIDEYPDYFVDVLSKALDLAKQFAKTRRKRPLTTEPLELAVERAIEQLQREGLPGNSEG